MRCLSSNSQAFNKYSELRAKLIELRQLKDVEEFEYQLVSALEADPSKGKISDQSPLGQAILGKMMNALVEVVAPHSKARYRIVNIA